MPNENTYSDTNVGHRYVYNETTGNLDREINRLDVVTDYEYYETGGKKKETFDIYEYDYNIKGNLTKVYVDGVNTLSYNYDEDYNLTSEVYANGQSIRYRYDDNNNLVSQYHNNDTSAYVTFSYNTDNELTQKVNADTGLKYVYGENNKVDVYKISDDTLVQSYTEDVTEADEDNGIEAKTDVTESHFGTTYSSVIKDKSVSYINGNNTFEYSYTENDNAVASDVIKYNGTSVLNAGYTYDDNGNITKKDYGNSGSVTNTYDTKDRITSTSYNGKTFNYTYDINSQLTAVSGNNYSASYAYDSRGNITNKNVNGTSTTFTYSNSDWKDELTAVNGTPLTYNENGNVLTYGDKSFIWNTGRNLASIVDGDNEYSYTYDENGIRTSKTVNGITTSYNTKDGVILYQTDGTDTLYFQYDTSGVPLGFIWNGTQYFYITNQMGDVISITDVQGNELAQYSYDEWGNTLSTSDNDIANINPLRYRGYYYDNETSYYYLQSRYYDPCICRFINADDTEIAKTWKNDKFSNNLYLYCNNDPINYSDYTGYYSARNAQTYADKWWSGHNPNYKSNENNGGDCANFVSQCLYAGGLSKMTGSFGSSKGWHHLKRLGKFQISNAWGNASYLFSWLCDNNFVQTTYILQTKSDVEKAAKNMKAMSRCTSVIFFDSNKSDGKINHATINGMISYTSSRKDIAYYAHTDKKNGTFSGDYRSSVKDYLGKSKGNKIVYIFVISFTFG